jgi:D-beta-D-heptose 7-phosphate kinase/D-beta-D-heptose 1-phosphate adenosyltransferase
MARAKTVRVLVVGDLMLDRYMTGSVDRISPEAPVPVVRVESEHWALGGAGNVASNVVALGATCDIVGAVGSDPEGRLVRERLGDLGIGIQGIVELPGRPTTVKTRVMAKHQHVTRIDREQAADIQDSEANVLVEHMKTLWGAAGAVALEDYNKGVLVSNLIQVALAAGRSSSVPVIVDPKRKRFFEYAGASVFKPNSRELEDALGESLRPEDPEWMEEVRARLDCGTLLLTLGESGMAVQDRNGGFMRVPTVARDVYDVSGAGDTVTAVMSVCLAAGADPLEAAVLANHAAAVEVGRAGVATVSPEEILEHQRYYAQKESP